MDNIYVLNTNFETVQVLDDYSSLIWTRRYATYGDFELYTAPTDELLEILQAGYYLVREQDVIENDEYRNVMIITDVEIKANEEDGDALIVTGKDLKSILLRRVIAGQTVLSGTVDACIARLLNTTIIAPSNSARRISNFVLGTNILRTSYTMELQVTGKVLADTLTEICTTYGYGYDIYVKAGRFVFYLFEGVDRSYAQDANPHVVFSGDFDNLLSSDYKVNRSGYSNVVYVAGEGEGTDRTIVSVGNAEGLNRFEQWVDARNASSNNGEITVAEYKRMLSQEGAERLGETVVTTKFEGEIEAFTNFAYGRDYFLGDIVQVRNDYGVTAQTRIIEVIDSLDVNGRNVVVTLSEMVVQDVDTTEYLLTETRDVITTEEDVGLLPEQVDAQTRAGSSATPVGYGLRISELSDITDLSGDNYFAIAKPDVLTYRVKVPIAFDGSDIVWNGRIMTPSGSGYVTDQYGNLKHRRSTNTDTWEIKNNSGTGVFKVNFETGHVINTELMTWAGTDITNGKANDTLTFWKNQGTCYALFSKQNMVNGQPNNTWGFLQSFVYGSEIYQLWFGQPNGKVWHRGAHASDTNMPNFSSLDGVMSGTWTPVVGRATKTSSEGVWYQRGGIIVMRGRIVFSSTQTNQGHIYIDQGSLPSIARNVGIIGTGMSGGAMCVLTSNHYTNDNVYVSTTTEAATNATSPYIKGQTLRFMLITETTA